ncbi:thiamine pyrophosphate-binding protein [Chloroflexota bacterium]
MTKMTGKEALMELLKNEGVEYIFGIPGATEVIFMEALEKYPEMKYILGLNEVVCAGAAEGYARVSGKAGVLNLHTSPGVAAAMPMLYNACQGGVPLVITAGQQDTRLLLREPALSGDLVGMARHFSKWSTEVLYADDIPVAVQRAFKVAKQPPTGPVFISLPQDVLEQNLDFECTPGTPVYSQLRPDTQAVQRAIELLVKSKSTIIILENGITRNEALSEVVMFAELTGARVYQPWMSDMNFPVNHPQYIGDIDPSNPQTVEILKSADVLVVIGCPLFSQAIYQPEPVIAETTNVIQIDDNPWEIAKNFPIAVGIQGNIKTSLTELCNLLQTSTPANAKQAAESRVKAITGEKEALNNAFSNKAEDEKDNIPISITRLMQELRDSIKPGTLVVDDCWSSSATLRRTLPFAESHSYQRARGGGSIGWGMPGALGVKLAAPEHPVVAVCGDGSALWSIQSLWTASRYNIPVTYIINVNQSYRQVKIMRKMILGAGKLNEKRPGMDLDEPSVNFSQLAQSMGVQGYRVERPDELGDTLKTAFDSNRPGLVEVYVENTP